jgi:hypothetical protein
MAKTPKTKAPKTAKSEKVADAIPAKVAAEKADPPVVKKTAAPRASAGKKGTAVKQAVSDEQRYRMIAEAAYYRAESRHFKSDPVRDWIEAERDIALLLGEGK